MRKILSLVTVLLLCACLVLPAFAAESNFVPSITYKPNPEIVSVVGEDGESYIGVIRNGDGEILDYVGHACLRVTPIAHVWDPEIEVPQEIEELLLFLYENLNNDTMEIPYELHEADLVAANMVIRDLFDARWLCEEHRKMLEDEGAYFEITFDLGVVADAEIFTMTFDEGTKTWSPIVKTVNNGDGTVTCTFAHLCGIEFSMAVAPTVAAAEGVQTNIAPWIVTLLAAVAAAAGVVVAKKKKTAA